MGCVSQYWLCLLQENTPGLTYLLKRAQAATYIGSWLQVRCHRHPSQRQDQGAPCLEGYILTDSPLDDGALHARVGSYTIATMLSSFSEATHASDMQIRDPPS